MQLSDFRALTFDCYGTLIDWETGLLTALQPLLKQNGSSLTRDEVLGMFAMHQQEQQDQTPRMIYSELLAVVHARMAEALGVSMPAEAHQQFGASVPEWPAFPDSAASLRYLKQHYQLFILSNVDRASFAGSNERLGVEFDAVYTAQDIGSYKPDLANFRFLIDRLGERGLAADCVLHTAQSLHHDHGPAQQIGLRSAWIDRRHDQPGSGATLPAPAARYDFRFASMADMAETHRRQA